VKNVATSLKTTRSRSRFGTACRIVGTEPLRNLRHETNTAEWGNFSMFSRSAGYAVQALTYLAAQPSGKLTGAREVGAAVGIPMPFLWKILRRLSQEKLVRSFKGVRGGYELARSAEKITLGQILAVTPDSDLASSCVLGLSQCDDRDPCPLHELWKNVRGEIEEMMRGTTLADLAHTAPRPGRKRARARRASTTPFHS
jgi:Rrf2 family iron-sulfur cluster assembly transcriptional regulator